MKQKTDYGLDAPIVIRNISIIGILCLAASIMAYYFLREDLKIILMLLM